MFKAIFLDSGRNLRFSSCHSCKLQFKEVEIPWAAYLMHHCSSCLPYLAVLYLNGQDFFFPVLKLNWTKIYFYPSW